MSKKLLIVLLVLATLVFTVTAANMQDTVTLTGYFNVVYGDPSPDSLDPGVTLVTLQDANGQVIARLETDYATLLDYNREYVQVSGEYVDLGGLNDALTQAPVLRVGAVQALDNAIGEELVSGSQPWVNILCKFSDIVSEPKAASAYAQFFSATYPGLDHYWRAVSYNLINLTGSQTVATWYTLPQPRSYYVDINGNPNLNTIANDCTAVADAAVNYPSFVGINIMLNSDIGCCAWGGSTTLTRDGQTRTYRMTWDPPWAQTHDVLAHEMGHGFGFPHSSGPADNPPNGLNIYVSSWDVMSNSGGTCLNSNANLGCIGQGVIANYVNDNEWIPLSRRSTVNTGQDTTVTIDRLQEPINGTGILWARVPINGSSSLYYTVEVRDVGSGYDLNVPAQAVVIHKVDLSTPGSNNTGPALVVDANDGNDNVNDAGARWLPGETFFDPVRNIRIEVLSQSGSSFSVRIRNNVATPSPVDLGAALTGTPNPYTPGSQVTFNFVISNTSANPATNTLAVLTLPTNTGVSVFSKPSQCTQSGATMTCALGTLNGGSAFNGAIVLNTTALTSGALTASIVTYADQSDTNGGNNEVNNVSVSDIVNDAPNNAIMITSLPFTTTLNTGGASNSNEPSPTCHPGIGKTVWYRYTPSANLSEVQVDSIGSTYDSVLAVYTLSGNTWTQVGCDDDSGGNYTSLITLQMFAGTTYYIQAGGYGGDFGQLTLNVTSDAAPPAPPVPVAPTGTITDTSPTFTWTGEGQLAWYYLWVSGPNGHVLDQWHDGWNICTGTTCSVTPTLDLLAGEYTFWVQQWTSAGGYSEWSSGMNFTVDAPPPVAVPIAPTGTITQTQPAFSWTGVTGYAWYQIWLAGPDGTVLNQWYESTNVCTGSACAITPALNLPGGTYRWWVQLWTPLGGYAAWSSEAMFIVALPPVAPTQIAPLGTISTTQPTFQWSRVTAGAWYYLWISGPSGTVLDQWYQVSVCSGSTCSVTPTLNLANGAYSWWIQAWSSEGGYGAWSPAGNFTVAAPSVEVVTPEAPPSDVLPGEVTPEAPVLPVEAPPTEAAPTEIPVVPTDESAPLSP